MSQHNTNQRLIDAGGLAVDLCDCGSIHLHMASITLRIEVSSFLRMVDALVIARQRLLMQWQRGERVMPGHDQSVA